MINSGLSCLPLLNNHDTLRGANLCSREISWLNRINLSNNAIMCILFAFIFTLVLADSTTSPVNLASASQFSQYPIISRRDILALRRNAKGRHTAWTARVQSRRANVHSDPLPLSFISYRFTSQDCQCST